jgi:hypothetical protein
VGILGVSEPLTDDLLPNHVGTAQKDSVHGRIGIPGVMKRLAAFFLSCTLPLSGQSSSGGFHFKVIDPTEASVKTTVEIVSEANSSEREADSPVCWKQ